MFWSRKFDVDKDLKDLSGKVVIVTGANTGIGYSTAKFLARKGAKVYVGSRSFEKGTEAVRKLKEEGVGSGEVVYLHVDLSTPELAKDAADTFLKQESKLDVLVNNAAMIYDGDLENITAADGIPAMMMTNHIGVFQFTMTLLPTLLKTAEQPGSDVRIVTVASDAHRSSAAANPDLNFTPDTLKEQYPGGFFVGFGRYAVSKLANVLMSNVLARHLSSKGIICLSLHPGFVKTSLPTKLSSRLAGLLMSIVALTPEQGAYTSCFAAASPIVKKEAEKYNGSYLQPYGKIVTPAPNALKVELQDQMWETSKKYLEGVGMGPFDLPK